MLSSDSCSQYKYMSKLQQSTSYLFINAYVEEFLALGIQEVAIFKQKYYYHHGNGKELDL